MSNNQNSNRTPRQEELALGKQIFQELITIFPTTEVFAIGRVAQKTLGLEEGNYIRHPAHGGANRCRKDLEDKVFSSFREGLLYTGEAGWLSQCHLHRGFRMKRCCVKQRNGRIRLMHQKRDLRTS